MLFLAARQMHPKLLPNHFFGCLNRMQPMPQSICMLTWYTTPSHRHFQTAAKLVGIFFFSETLLKTDLSAGSDVIFLTKNATDSRVY